MESRLIQFLTCLRHYKKVFIPFYQELVLPFKLIIAKHTRNVKYLIESLCDPMKSARSNIVLRALFYMICSSAQLSTTRTPISSRSATGNRAMLVWSNFGQSRASGFNRRSSVCCRFRFILSPGISLSGKTTYYSHISALLCCRSRCSGKCRVLRPSAGKHAAAPVR